MRPWITYIVTNPNVYADFISWARESESALRLKLADSVRSGESDDARGIAHELLVYETIRKKIEAEMRELTAQVAYSEQNERRQIA